MQKEEGYTHRCKAYKSESSCGSNGGSHGGPRPGYELAVVSKQDKEHEERATVDIILDDDVAGGIGAGESM